MARLTLTEWGFLWTFDEWGVGGGKIWNTQTKWNKALPRPKILAVVFKQTKNDSPRSRDWVMKSSKTLKNDQIF